MSLNIKNEETHRLAKELAQLTGESISDAVGQAVRERLERLRKERMGLAKRLLAIGEETAPYFTGIYKTVEHGDLLYDERGLPK